METIDKNHFEDIVDAMMLDGIDGMNDSFRDAIKSLPNDKKRMTILSLLDKDLNLFKKIKALTDTNINKMDHIKDIILMLREYVKVGEVEKKKFGEVMTPLDLVKEMLATLPVDVWSNPRLKWLDPANGTGPYPIMVIYKLMKGLEKWEPNEELRYKHIIENMIYVCEIQPKNQFLYLCAIDPKDEYTCNVYTGSFLEEGFDKHMKEIWNVDKFDIVIGNPPYQEEVVGGSEKALYNRFITKGLLITNKLLFIVPSRWFAGGKGLDGFRKMMLSRTDIRIIKHFDDATKIFGNGVDITGGVSYFFIDSEYNGKTIFNDIEIELNKYDILVKNVNYYKIIDKFSKLKGIDTICKGQSYSGITTNDSRLNLEKINEDYIKCHVSKINGYEKWIDKKYIKDSCDYSTWKVITVEANGSYPKFGNKIICKPGELCNQSYIVFFINSEEESRSLLSYLNTKLVNKMLSIRKVSQHIKPDTCKWIPIVPFDREWTDEKLFEYFDLSEEEIELINNTK